MPSPQIMEKSKKKIWCPLELYVDFNTASKIYTVNSRNSVKIGGIHFSSLLRGFFLLFREFLFSEMTKKLEILFFYCESLRYFGFRYCGSSLYCKRPFLLESPVIHDDVFHGHLVGSLTGDLTSTGL